MAIGSYDEGSLLRLSAAFTVAGTPTDPTAVVCKVIDPQGTVQTLTATQDTTGNYHADLDLTNAKPGLWSYRFAGSGACQAAEEAQFYVEASAF